MLPVAFVGAVMTLQSAELSIVHASRLTYIRTRCSEFHRVKDIAEGLHRLDILFIRSRRHVQCRPKAIHAVSLSDAYRSYLMKLSAHVPVRFWRSGPSRSHSSQSRCFSKAVAAVVAASLV
jgi:hypothetical protein